MKNKAVLLISPGALELGGGTLAVLAQPTSLQSSRLSL